MVSRAIRYGWPLVGPSRAYSAPSFAVAPTVSGYPYSGGVLTVAYTAAGWPLPSEMIQWRRDGGDIPGATSLSYTSTDADIGRNITPHVRLSNVNGYVAASGAATLILGGGASPDPGAALIAWDNDAANDNLLQWDDANGNPQYLEWDI